METGIEQIAKERARVIAKGLSPEYDLLENSQGQLNYAASIISRDHIPAICYTKQPHNWSREVWEKMLNNTLKRRLVIAGQLCAAAVDVLQAKEQSIYFRCPYKMESCQYFDGEVKTRLCQNCGVYKAAHK